MNHRGLTIYEIHKGLINKKFSARELALSFSSRIKKKDKDISAFITTTEDLALSQAKKVDELISSGKEVPLLAGVPMAVKDNILVEGVKATAGSKILENYISPYNATVMDKLLSLGAVVLGKTNMDEFGMGASTENSAFFPTKNPHDLEMVPGGSSGGSAAAVASGMAVYALGSDTGGSVRQPASFCGVTGLRPTYGAVSRYGLIAFASSLDQIGPIAKTAEDAALVFKELTGKDKMDSTSIDFSWKKDVKVDIKKIRIGVPKEYFVKGMDGEVEKVVKEAVKRYEKMGAEIKEISLPHTKYAVPTYYLINTSEASSNLARYDGMRYGLSEKEDSLLDVYKKSKEKGFGSEVKRRIMLGAYALSAGYYDAFYLKSEKVRTLIIEDFNKAFEEVDVVLSPTSPTLPFKIGEKITDPVSMYLCDVFTAPAALVGLPAVSVPGGFAGKLPVGFQLIGQPFEDYKILKIGEFFQ